MKNLISGLVTLIAVEGCSGQENIGAEIPRDLVYIPYQEKGYVEHRREEFQEDIGKVASIKVCELRGDYVRCLSEEKEIFDIMYRNLVQVDLQMCGTGRGRDMKCVDRKFLDTYGNTAIYRDYKIKKATCEMVMKSCVTEK